MIAPLSDAERFAWLRLSRCDGIGPRTFVGLIQRFGSAGAALDALPSLIRRGRTNVALSSRDACLREYEESAKRGLRLIALNEPCYPPALRVIDSAPPLIAVRGDVSVLQRPMVAIVGARNASAAGLMLTERLTSAIAASRFIIVSGLARGVDAKAHRAALATGTVAVLAGGHDRIYPAEHEGLARDIVETGAIVSEMPLGWEARGRDFPRRNRIVSGLSLGTLVVEAARRSGSLITARFANEQGREVFAVPGSPLDPRAEGTNDLLRQGATFCTRADDVIDALGAMQVPAARPEGPSHGVWAELSGEDEGYLEDGDGDLDPGFPRVGGNSGSCDDDAAQIAQLLGPSPTTVDDLVRLSGLSPARVRSVLIDMEMTGGLDRQGAVVSRVDPNAT